MNNTWTIPTIMLSNYIFQVYKMDPPEYNMDPEHQRDEIYSKEFAQNLIKFLIMFRKSPSVFSFHTLKDGTKESLDGKNRSASIRDFMEDKFPLKKITDPGYECYSKKKFSQFTDEQKRAFKNINLITEIYGGELTAEQIEEFFINVQKANATSSGEKIGANTVSKFGKAISEKIRSKPEFKTTFVKFFQNEKRKVHLQMFSVCAVLYNDRNIDKYIMYGNLWTKTGIIESLGESEYKNILLALWITMDHMNKLKLPYKNKAIFYALFKFIVTDKTKNRYMLNHITAEELVEFIPKHPMRRPYELAQELINKFSQPQENFVDTDVL